MHLFVMYDIVSFNLLTIYSHWNGRLHANVSHVSGVGPSGYLGIGLADPSQCRTENIGGICVGSVVDGWLTAWSLLHTHTHTWHWVVEESFTAEQRSLLVAVVFAH